MLRAERVSFKPAIEINVVPALVLAPPSFDAITHVLLGLLYNRGDRIHRAGRADHNRNERETFIGLLTEPALHHALLALDLPVATYVADGRAAAVASVPVSAASFEFLE